MKGMRRRRGARRGGRGAHGGGGTHAPRTAIVLPSGERIADSAGMGILLVMAPVARETMLSTFASPSRRTHMNLSEIGRAHV